MAEMPSVVNGKWEKRNGRKKHPLHRGFHLGQNQTIHLLGRFAAEIRFCWQSSQRTKGLAYASTSHIGRYSSLKFILEISLDHEEHLKLSLYHLYGCSTGWQFGLFKTFVWHQNKGCVMVHGPHAKMELLFWCQLEVWNNLNGNPVYC